MAHLSMDYRLSLYSELIELSKDKIYMVQNSLDNKIYIKKILYPENFEVYTKLKEISSANIPKIHEIIKVEDRLIVIEEYINGSTLEEILAESKTISQTKVIEYTMQLCNVLDILHNCNPSIIHRDIKPSNIIISNDHVLKLIDFDVSRTHKDIGSTDTEILGTYGYAAPEQFGFSQSDARTDIYSLGITMNVLLTGKIPKLELYTGSLSNIIAKCTAFDPDKRFQNIKELKEALNNKKNKETLAHRNYKLPGFKSGKSLFKIISSLWYGLLILIGLGFFSEDPSFESRYTDILLVFFFFSLTLLFGNFNNLKNKLPLLSSNRWIVRLFAYISYIFLMVLLTGVLMPS